MDRKLMPSFLALARPAARQRCIETAEAIARKLTPSQEDLDFLSGLVQSFRGNGLSVNVIRFLHDKSVKRKEVSFLLYDVAGAFDSPAAIRKEAIHCLLAPGADGKEREENRVRVEMIASNPQDTQPEVRLEAARALAALVCDEVPDSLATIVLDGVNGSTEFRLEILGLIPRSRASVEARLAALKRISSKIVFHCNDGRSYSLIQTALTDANAGIQDDIDRTFFDLCDHITGGPG